MTKRKNIQLLFVLFFVLGFVTGLLSGKLLYQNSGYFAQAQTTSTLVNLTLGLHGIGTGGDNVLQTATGNTNPIHPQRSVTVKLYNSVNQLTASKTGTVSYQASTGKFTGQVDLGAIQSGSYTIDITISQYLVKRVPGIVNLISGTVNSIPTQSLITGDTDNNNFLNTLDYNRILDCFSELLPAKNCFDPLKKQSADLTDNGTVDQFDYNLFIRELSVQSGDGDLSPVPTSTVPSPTSGSGVFNQPSDSELSAAGFLNVVIRGADPTCVKDSTLAIQAAMDEAYAKNMVTYFPSGTYCISDTLHGYKQYTSHSVGHSKGYELMGSTLGAPPIIRLKANSPGFNSTSSPKPVLTVNNICAFEGCGTNEAIGQDIPANGFMQSIRNIDIEVEAGNNGAIGVSLTGAQNNSLLNVSVKLTSGYAGFDGMVGDNSSISDLEVIGGKYGIISRSKPLVRWPSITNVRLIDQTDAAITNYGGTNWMISGLYIKKTKGPAILTTSGSQSTENITILDGKIEFTQLSTEPAIDNTADKAIALINVYFNNATTLFKSPRTTLSGGSGWRKIENLGYSGKGVNVINGTVSNLTHNTGIETASPPANLLTRHSYNPVDFPSVDVILGRIKGGDSTYANAADHGILPSADDISPDVTTKLQNLINSGVGTIFFPKGRYVISNTILLGSNTHLTGISNQDSGLVMSKNWKPTAANPATMVRTVDSATASPKISFFAIKEYTTAPPNDFHNGILHIRSGKTVMLDTVVRPKLSSVTTELQPNIRILMNGNAGGKFFGLTLGANQNRNQHTGYRHLLINGTVNPIVIYGANPEDQNFNGATDGWGMEVKNSSNVAFLGTKQENHNTLLVTGSQNIAALSLSNYDNLNFTNSNNYIGSMYPKFYEPGEVLYREIYSGITTSVIADKEIGLFKRGSVNWNLIFSQ